MENKQKRIGIACACLLFVFVAVFAIIFLTNREKPVEGSKSIVIEVLNKAGESKKYELKTDAEYLRQAMEEAKGLEFSGTESEYGMMVETINGETAIYAEDSSYWAIYVNGEYGMYGIDSQPVEDQDNFLLKHEVYE